MVEDSNAHTRTKLLTESELFIVADKKYKPNG